MPPAALVAGAAVDPGQAAAFQAACEAVAGLSVAVLDEKQPERVWHRWMQALLDVVATRPIFKAELEFTGALTAVVALTPALLGLWGSFTSVWWLQKVWKPSGPSRRKGRRPPEGGAHLGHVFRGQVPYHVLSLRVSPQS